MAAPRAGRRVVMFSGGSAANSLVDVFTEVAEKSHSNLTYVIPTSDNGGSTSELIRVFGGPGIGDVRSRLVRLIPKTNSGIYSLFNHRLPSDPSLASTEFSAILDGTHELWRPLPSSQALLIRSIFSHLHLEILKRARPPNNTFNFQSAAIGNLFLTGARLFSGSFESAIYLLALIGGVDESKAAVVPSIVSNFMHHIAAGLEDGTVISGQNAISHPGAPTALPSSSLPSPSIEPKKQWMGVQYHGDPNEEDAMPPSALPDLRLSSIAFSKAQQTPLPSPIQRIWYISPYGHEMRPTPNPNVLNALNDSEAIIYSIGSLYTSILPSLILRGVGQAIASRPQAKKILILNGSLDRETGGYTALNFIEAIAHACEESQDPPKDHKETSGRVQSPSDATSLLRPTAVSQTSSNLHARRSHPYLHPPTMYVTHLIHVGGDGTPVVENTLLNQMGVKCFLLRGLKPPGEDGMRYHGGILAQTLEEILRRED